MAIYKGREVQLLGRSNGEDTSPLYDIVEAGNQRSSVPFNQLQLTEKEKSELSKQGVLHLDNANVISDKDLKDLRDSQNREFIEKNQKTQSPAPVSVSKVMVDPSEVSEKSSNKHNHTSK